MFYTLKIFIALHIICSFPMMAQKDNKNQSKPWENGKLKVSDNKRFLQHENGEPFFWLGDTGWLMPQRLNRDEVGYYLNRCQAADYNVVQIQTLNGVPSINVYGQLSSTPGFGFEHTNNPSVYGYWDHMDYIIKTAENRGIYIGMVCIWGGLVKAGLMDEQQARVYGEFLAERYKNSPNIIWIIGGDTRGDINTEVWETLANTIKKIDKNHLMTFHPFGRTTSATWFNDAAWLDFNMFQSGHRRYGQRKGDGSTIDDNAEEDNWRYVEKSYTLKNMKPVLDAEPSYEDIPHGLHDPEQARWKDSDVRRYAYWSVFAGACGHTYGNNSIMQFYRPEISPAYGANKWWWNALDDPGFNQMKHLKNLMSLFPYFDRIPDQSIIAGENGTRYDRLIATRGKDYLLVYNYTGRPMRIDLTKISGDTKSAWWYNTKNGQIKYIGLFNNQTELFQHDAGYMNENDQVLVVFDASKEYIKHNDE